MLILKRRSISEKRNEGLSLSCAQRTKVILGQRNKNHNMQLLAARYTTRQKAEKKNCFN